MTKQKTIKGQGWYYVILCYSYKEPLISGVYGSKNEAEKANEEIKECKATHKIKKCEVKVII